MRTMSHTFARCRECKRHKSQVRLSSRGLCSACAMGRLMANAASAVAAMHAAQDTMGEVHPFNGAFQSLERPLAD